MGRSNASQTLAWDAETCCTVSCDIYPCPARYAHRISSQGTTESRSWGLSACCYEKLECSMVEIEANCVDDCIWTSLGCRERPRSCSRADVDCAVVYYEYEGLDEHLKVAHILTSGDALTAQLNAKFANVSHWEHKSQVLSTVYDSSSVHFSSVSATG